MKITDISTIPIDRYLLVQIETNEGISGLGESGAWGYLRASERVLDKFRNYLIGKDPLAIEHHWQYMYRCFHFRGAAIMGAISAVDIALWDIAGKYFEVPVYKLLGGPCRDKARVYHHVFGSTPEELVEDCKEAKDQGYSAVGHLNPFLDEPRSDSYFKPHAEKLKDAVEVVKRCREAVGDEVDLCIEIHRRLEVSEAITFAHEIEQFMPYFYEDPIRPDNFDSMGRVANNINIPIATGERLHTIEEFQSLLKREAAEFIRPDVCLAGGITHTKKIAALAEAHGVQVVPHNPLSPLSTLACVQLAASIPNFAIQEHPKGEDESPKKEIFDSPLEIDDGFAIVTQKPGIGIELKDGAREAFPYKDKKINTRLHEDGSVVDQ